MKTLIIGKGKSGEAAAKLLRERGDEVDFADGYGLVVTSPGVPVKSELQLGCEELLRRGVKLLAVTGSKGKSSVVKLVADAIGGVACGNFGLPVSEVGECKWAVVEVSSFQLETTHLPPNVFEAAAVLNLQEDHLDRHGDISVYHSLKRSLASMARLAVLPETLEKLANVEALVSLMRGSYFDNSVLRANGAAAIVLMRAAGLDDAAVRSAFLNFKPLPHRMSEVARLGGVRYVDDSKATSIAALAAGIEMCASPVRLIAGGLPKGDDPKSALPILTRWVKKVYIIGVCAEKFSSAWSGSVDCEVCGTLENAVEAASRDAEDGETVLLSPGAASFDQFKNFEKRGEVFASLIQKRERSTK